MREDTLDLIGAIALVLMVVVGSYALLKSSQQREIDAMKDYQAVVCEIDKKNGFINEECEK